MRFASLGSGSRGNATLVEQGDTLVMVDCGFSVRETVRRLARLGRTPEQVTAILVTHEHGDHVGGVARFARRYNVPVWMTAGTRSVCRDDMPRIQLFNSHAAFAVGELEMQPFPVPHDARDPAQFVFSNGDRRLGILTDTGSSTPHIEQQLSGCDVLLLECNHDVQMLANGAYPASLKARVGGEYGHLSNLQAAHLLSRLDHSRLQKVIGAHLSEKNNAPSLARAALVSALGGATEAVLLADQEQGLPWTDVC